MVDWKFVFKSKGPSKSEFLKSYENACDLYERARVDHREAEALGQEAYAEKCLKIMEIYKKNILEARKAYEETDD